MSGGAEQEAFCVGRCDRKDLPEWLGVRVGTDVHLHEEGLPISVDGPEGTTFFADGEFIILGPDGALYSVPDVRAGYIPPGLKRAYLRRVSHPPTPAPAD